MRAQLASVRLKRLMVSAAIVQDLADSLLALNDIRGASDQCKQSGCGQAPQASMLVGLHLAGYLEAAAAPLAA